MVCLAGGSDALSVAREPHRLDCGPPGNLQRRQRLAAQRDEEDQPLAGRDQHACARLVEARDQRRGLPPAASARRSSLVPVSAAGSVRPVWAVQDLPSADRLPVLQEYLAVRSHRR